MSEENVYLTFNLCEDYIELNKLLKLMGLAETGGQAKQLIAEGYIQVDGKVETRKAFKVREGMSIQVANQIITMTSSGLDY